MEEEHDRSHGVFFPSDIRLWDQCNVEAFLDMRGAGVYVPALLAAGYTDGPALATLDLHALASAGVADPRARVALLRAIYVVAGRVDELAVLDKVLEEGGVGLRRKTKRVKRIKKNRAGRVVDVSYVGERGGRRGGERG